MSSAVTSWNDIYHGNAPFLITKAVVCKAGEGLLFTDPSYRAFLAQAASGGHHAFGYYALHTGGSAEIAAQARRAFALIGTRPAMYDAEEWPRESGSPAGMVSLSELCLGIDLFRESGGVMNVCYLPRSQWQRMGSPNLAPLAWRRIRLVNADYRPGSEVPGSAAWDSYGGMAPWAVQWKPCNNVARGSWSDALAVWQGTVPPSSPRPGIDYTVRSGDTMASIADAHGVTLADLERANPRAGHPAGNFGLIWPGDELVIP